MPSTLSTTSASQILVQRVRTKYHWPPIALNFWIIIMLIGSCLILGVFANFMGIQSQMGLGTPWYFAYWVTCGSLGVVFILLMLYLISQRQLLPGIVILGAFILFILWLVGLIVISIELWGPAGDVNGNCNIYVDGMSQHGATVQTLAWLQQRSICQAWLAAWAFMLVGVVFLAWMMGMAYQVYKDDV